MAVLSRQQLIKISNKKDENKEKKTSKSMRTMYMCDEIYSNCTS